MYFQLECVEVHTFPRTNGVMMKTIIKDATMTMARAVENHTGSAHCACAMIQMPNANRNKKKYKKHDRY